MIGGMHIAAVSIFDLRGHRQRNILVNPVDKSTLLRELGILRKVNILRNYNNLLGLFI